MRSITTTSLLAALVLSSAIAHAQYTATGVFYDYTQVEIGGRAQFVLVPRGTDAFALDAPLTISIPAAFRILRENKRATYGNASLTLSDADVERGRVVVHIDPEQRDWHLIVVAETVYTFTELGATEVVFPGLYDEPWTREDVPFLAYVLHAPMWRALQGSRITHGMIRLADGSHMQAADFYRAWEAGDPDLQQQLLRYLSEGSTVEQTNVLGLLAESPVPGAVDAALPLLQNESEGVRLAAVSYLSATGDDRVLERLADVMSNDDSPDVRAAAAEALGTTGDARFEFFEQLHQLQEASEGELPAAISAVAATGDPRAVESLMEYVSASAEPVRQAAIDGLMALDATDRLFEVLVDETPLFIRLQVGETIAEGGGADDRVRALEHLTGAREGTIALGYLQRLASLVEGEAGPSARRAIERQLQHEDAAVRLEVATLLAGLGDADSVEVVAQAAEAETDLDVQAALDETAMVLMSSLTLSDVQSYAQSRTLFLKRAAYRALGQFARQGQANQATFGTLVEGLSSGEAVIRGAAVLGLASYANDEAYEAIARLAGDADPQVRRDLAQGLAAFPAGRGTDVLVGFVGDSDDTVVAAALRSLGERGEVEALPTVLELAGADSARIRAAAAEAAGALGHQNEEVQRTVIDTLMGATGDREAIVRQSAAIALGNFNSEMAVVGLSPLTQDHDPQVRLRAIAALGDTQHLAAVGVLVSLLEDVDVDVRLAALQAIGALGMRSAVPEIEAAMSTEQDPSVLSAARAVLEQLGQ